MASPDAELKVRIDAELAAGFLTAFKTGGKIPKEFADKVDAELKRAAAQAAKTSAVLGGSMVRSSNQAAFALNNLGRVAQDAPFGFIGIQNNLNPLLESFQQLRKESGSNALALKSLVGALTGAAGVGLALSLVSAAVLAWPKIMGLFADSNEEATKSLKEQRDEFTRSPFEKASTDLTSLIENVRLAKEGFLSKKEVLKQYNEGIGQTIGKVTSLDAAEQKLVKNGDAYLKLMLLKANAEFAFKKAAEASFDQAQKQLEIDKRFKVNPNFDINRDRSLKVDNKPVLLSMDELSKRISTVSQGLDGIKKKAIIDPNLGKNLLNDQQLADFQDKASQTVKIAKSAQQEIIDFAKANGFNINKIFGTDDNGKGVGDKIKTISDIFKELSTDIAQANNNISGTFSDQNKEKVNAYQKAIDELIKIGIDPAARSIESLKKAANEFADVGTLKVLTGGLSKVSGEMFAGLPKIGEGLPEVKKAITENVLTPFQSILVDVIPQIKSGFENFFNDILEKGKFSFASLGQAIIKTFASIAASQAATALLNLVASAANIGGSTIGGGGVAKNIAGAAGSALPLLAGGAAASGGLLLPILGGIAAAGLIASLFKKKKSDPYLQPAAVATSSGSNVGSADFAAGRVVFEISGTNLIGVLNRAGQRLQRYNIV